MPFRNRKRKRPVLASSSDEELEEQQNERVEAGTSVFLTGGDFDRPALAVTLNSFEVLLVSDEILDKSQIWVAWTHVLAANQVYLYLYDQKYGASVYDELAELGPDCEEVLQDIFVLGRPEEESESESESESEFESEDGGSYGP